MVNKYWILSILILSFMTSSVYAQTGPAVPNIISTQSNYCLNGTCATAPIQSVPTSYSKSLIKLPILLISLSQTCETLNKQGMKDCPSVKDLMSYDTSNQMISGKFVNHNDIYIRDPPQVKNNWLLYSYSNKPVICVECNFDILATQQSKQIIIEPKDFTFVNKTAIVSKHIWTSWQGRYMQGCDTATIGNIPGLLNDTIKYMLSGCINTSFNGTKSYIIPDKPWEYNNPYSTLHQEAANRSLLHNHSSYVSNMTLGGFGPSNLISHPCNCKSPYANW